MLGDAFQTNYAVRRAAGRRRGHGGLRQRSILRRSRASTVDLATELTNMVQAQSSYEANSKVFQTGAKILDVLNNIQS